MQDGTNTHDSLCCRGLTPNLKRDTLYFAYGSNMDYAQMAKRCQNYQYISTAVLHNHQFIINSRGVASIVPKYGEIVYGVIWALSDEDVNRLDRYEGVSSGFYRKETMPVTMPNFLPIDVLIYIATDSAQGKPRPGYLETIIAAAVKLGLPDGYIRELQGWLSLKDKPH